jgi:hypothetical protein
MGEFIKPRKVSKDEIKVCEQCKNEGLKTSFRFVKTSDKRIIELCFNCQQRPY